ncbi:hypothetical protein SAMD00019534_038120 [Acytostelium subglobosum LB1]|uniref:hypothetical protein n=1 Tax=Acytostelium subglobosum LB1 TaxID=1410327 RepID=UPI00064490FD|nr:hypothetical protein SAMD00019534_038120 [Acytostelium subglobosum LB1]GAM20637.1 hypothetical protein SAMD00019534_038120 [Acytostelium subglobosum LB1]|eukprot:XP_012760158.1 hypothetical protein SAMD00019534_038120 [Acytostelium subglobosum LB1]
MSTTNKQQQELAVPGFFPAVTSECKEVAAKFFICIEKSMVSHNDEDIDAPRRGLRYCEKQLIDYTVCMEQSLAKGSPNIH